jgi:hypothetical protein
VPTAQPIERVVLTTAWPEPMLRPLDKFTDDRWPGIVFEVRAEERQSYDELWRAQQHVDTSAN